jgi:N-acetylglucosamine malate deacetylase 1
MRKVALFLAPHPDDESITGLFPLRLQEEFGFKIWVVPATLGSREERRAARREELRSACAVLGFQLRFMKSLDCPADRRQELCGLLESLAPAVVFIPHGKDGHPTHRATHQLGIAAMDAARQPVFHVVETEYWHPMEHPNLMVAASTEQMAKLRSALMCHAGEMGRNDYAARLPAWMSDNVRRGAELIGGMGGGAPNIPFATLYRARRRTGGAWRPEFRSGRIVESSEDLGKISALWT